MLINEVELKKKVRFLVTIVGREKRQGVVWGKNVCKFLFHLIASTWQKGDSCWSDIFESRRAPSPPQMTYAKHIVMKGGGFPFVNMPHSRQPR